MSAIPTLATAARDATALAEEGVYIHRRLAEQLFDAGVKIWTTDREKTAFVTASPAERAEALATALKEYDAKNGGAPAGKAAPKAEEKAAEAAPAKTGRGSRQPQTTAGKAEEKAAPKDTSPGDGVQALLLAIKGLDEKVAGIAADVAEIGKLESSNGVAITELKSMVLSLAAIQHTQLGLLCLFGQQVLGAPMEAFLEDAPKDADKALELLETQGKG